MKWSKENYFDLYEKENIIYLTPDSENTLEKIENGKCYIIGGIIDRNSHKNLTLQKANELGIKTSKFPLNEYCKLISQVLTVDQSFGILLNHYNLNNWETSIMNSIPKRKINKNEEDEEYEDNE